MTKCKFCKKQAMFNVGKYGWKEFGVCEDCMKWLLIELDNLKEEK